MIYSSDVALMALKLMPSGAPHTGPDCHCAMCGKAIRQGDLSASCDFNPTFTDFAAIGSSGMRCGACERLGTQAVIAAFQCVVATTRGVYSLRSDEARSWLWLTPPEPPFVVVLNSSTMFVANYLQRTPVTVDKDLITVNVDGRLHQIRRLVVLGAMEHIKTILEHAPRLERKKSAMKSPFKFLDRDGKADNHGKLHADVLELATLFPDCTEAAAALKSLGTGELLALSALTKQAPKPSELFDSYDAYDDERQKRKSDKAAAKEAAEAESEASAVS